MRKSNGTIQGMIDGGFITTAYCHNSKCQHHAELDWFALRDKLGPDHGSMRDDIVPKLKCSKCGGRKIGLIMSPDPAKTVGMASYRNSHERPKGGR